MPLSWQTSGSWTPGVSSYPGPGPFVEQIFSVPGDTGDGTLLRTFATFSATSIVSYTGSMPFDGWWTQVNLAAGLFVNPPNVTPGPDYLPPLDTAGQPTLPWVIWSPLELSSVFTNPTSKTQAFTWRTSGGLLESKAERKMDNTQQLWFTIQGLDDGYLGHSFENGLKVSFGYTAYVNSLFNYTEV